MSSEAEKKVDELIRWDTSGNPEWMKRINMDEYEKLSGIGYTPQQIAMYYNIPVAEFEFYFHLVDSPLEYHYRRGQLLQQAKEGLNMSVSAATGENVTQAQRFDKLRKEMGYQNSVNQIFFDN
jgi:hypothetical protein